MKIRTSELTGAALDWAVDKAEGRIRLDGGYYCAYHGRVTRWSTDWAQGGPIIEREHISIESTRVGGLGDRWMATAGDCAEFADSPLIAAMRCYVASKLGDEVEIPKEVTP